MDLKTYEHQSKSFEMTILIIVKLLKATTKRKILKTAKGKEYITFKRPKIRLVCNF